MNADASAISIAYQGAMRYIKNDPSLVEEYQAMLISVVVSNYKAKVEAGQIGTSQESLIPSMAKPILNEKITKLTENGINTPLEEFIFPFFI